MTFKFSATSCVLALLLAACGGGGTGTSNPSTTGTPAPTGPTTPTTAPTGSGGSYFINGTVDGTARNGTKDVSWSEVGPNTASMVANTTDVRISSWSIQHLKRAAGTYSCNGGIGNNVVITFTDPTVIVDPILDSAKMQVTTASSPGACTVTVTAVTATEIEGTFTATLHNQMGYTRTVTNGSFKVAKSPV